MTKTILTIIALGLGIGLPLLKWYLGKVAAERKKKEDAQAKLDKAVDSGNRIDVIDSFNDTK
jgi:hypothetical protein